MPVSETKPRTAASPCTCVSRSTSPSRQPACAWATFLCGSTHTPRMSDMSSISAPSAVARPAMLCPPPLMQSRSVVVARELHARDHVGDAEAARDDGGLSVDHGVPDGSGLLIAGVARQRTPAPGGASSDRRACPASARSRDLVSLSLSWSGLLLSWGRLVWTEANRQLHPWLRPFHTVVLDFLMNTNEPQDAICNPWDENRLEGKGKNGKLDEVREIPRQSISPVSDKSLGYQGNPINGRTHLIFN